MSTSRLETPFHLSWLIKMFIGIEIRLLQGYKLVLKSNDEAVRGQNVRIFIL